MTIIIIIIIWFLKILNSNTSNEGNLLLWLLKHIK